MKSGTIRLLLMVGVICVVGITITQIYWFRQAFNAEEDRFDRQVSSALYNVARQIFQFNDLPAPAVNPIKQLSTDYYVVMINTEIDANLLESLLVNEFTRNHLQADFEYGIYDCTNEKMVYGNYVSFESGQAHKASASLPVWEDQSYYFGVQFPQKSAQITNRMGIWLFSSVVLLIVIAFFAYTLFLILKQKRLSEVQRDFINNMTHEFKTPISTISVAAQVLKDPQISQQPERLQNYAHIIDTENLRLKNQVERVLTVASLDQDSMKKERVDLHDLIINSARSVEATLKEKRGKIVTKLEARNSQVIADPLHLTNVLYNLLDNAIKYCDRIPLVEIITRNEQQSVSLTIKDNGIGIADDHIKKIFHKFYRVPTGNVHDVKGFGLGLNYVQTVVQAHGGNISLKSSTGQGTIFKLILDHA